MFYFSGTTQASWLQWKKVLHPLCLLWFFMAHFYLSVCIRTIAGTANQTANQPSKYYMQSFFCSTPQVNLLPIPHPADLLQIVAVSSPDWTALATSAHKSYQVGQSRYLYKFLWWHKDDSYSDSHPDIWGYRCTFSKKSTDNKTSRYEHHVHSPFWDSSRPVNSWCYHNRKGYSPADYLSLLDISLDSHQDPDQAVHNWPFQTGL